MSAAAPPRALDAGLYFVSTPIGNARDITLRALDILGAADVLAAEDTRSLRRLMEIHGVALSGRRVIAYHDHNGAVARPKLLAALAEGRSVAYASEAGTPLVADPGFALGRAAIGAGARVFSAPGPVAAIAALTVSGLPSDRFTFAGFPPTSGGARRKFLGELSAAPGTLILYESPKRLSATLADCETVLGGDRRAAVCRELTKRFEEVLRGSLGSLSQELAGRTLKGEIVLCIDRGEAEADPEALEAALKLALKTAKLKEAARVVAERFGASKRDVYQLGLTLNGKD
jgi:16S rRNA (cytidine1402-2'-O)-methyltransferase